MEIPRIVGDIGVMTPERWQRIKAIFHAALERTPEDRAAFLSSGCDGDEQLRNEVESLLESHQKSGEFIDSPAYESATRILAEEAELSAGQTIAHYEIISTLGKGGMGEVYLAQDRKLGRRVALKVLPASFTHDENRLRRFELEAYAASALNHPNILTVHEIGSAAGHEFFATEFVDGETLRQRLTRGPLTIHEAFRITIQIAEALTAAHGAGIIHRDIKPENVMIRRDGYVKVLDFGLAKLAQREDGDPEDVTRRLVQTSTGVVMGTATHMSPEQARGLTVDERTDIWSLGVVIYEMITRNFPFLGSTNSDLIVSILEREPKPLSALNPEVPANLQRIVSKALQKDREERYQTVRDLWMDLKALERDPLFVSVTADARLTERTPRLSHENSSIDYTRRGSKRAETHPASGLKSHTRAALMAIAALIGIGLIVGIYKLLIRHESNSTAIEAPPVGNISRITAWSGLDTQPTLSPDGNSVAYSSDHNGGFEIYVKQLASGGREIQLTSDGEENLQPAWSPDGALIAFYSKKRGGIWIVPALGGSSRQITEFGSAPAWSQDQKMIAFQSESSSALGELGVGSSTIWIVPLEGGAPRQITKVGTPVGGHSAPSWSPDGQRISFVDVNYSTRTVWSISTTDGSLQQLTNENVGPVGNQIYARDPGRLYFSIGAVLWMVPLSPTTGAPVGSPIKVADLGASRMTNMTLSADGKRMAYSVQTLTSNLWSVPITPNTNDASGLPQSVTNETDARNSIPSFSPDGRRIAFVKFLRGGGTNVWIADGDGKNATQITGNTGGLIAGQAGWGNVPNWLPDGNQLAIISRREGRGSVWAVSIQTKIEKPFLDIGRDIEYALLSPNGKKMALNLPTDGITNIWIVSLEDKNPVQLTFDHEFAGFPCWSPDGKVIAYQKKRGDDANIMVISTNGGEPTQLTFDRGRRWPFTFAPDGDHIAFAGENDGVWNVFWVSRSTKQRKQLTNYTKLNAYVRYPAWSPLGNQIVYEYAETTGNIWLMELK